MCRGRLRPGAIPCILNLDGETTKNRTEQSNNKSIEDDLLGSLNIKTEISVSENNEDEATRGLENLQKVIKTEVNLKKLDDLLDRESSEAVIDELINEMYV